MSQPSQEVLFYARCQLEAMLAANQERARRNEALAYTEEAFLTLAEDTREAFQNARSFDTP